MRLKKLLFIVTLLLNVSLIAQTTYVPDDNFEQALIDLGYDTVLDDYVLTNNILYLGILNIPSRGINDLTGIEDFTGLYFLDISGNNLTEIDLRNNTALQQFYCISNLLTILDLSQNVVLNHFSAANNQLNYVNLQNGNNINMSSISTLNNPNLTCIQVDNIAYSTANWSSIDIQTSFSTNCGYTYIPDDNFEQALINLGLDTVLDNYVTTSNISTLINLDISNKNIYDLTGIEDFTSLQYLNCINNNIQYLDIMQNTALTSLRCSQNSLTTLNVSQNINLGFLICSQNLLTELNVSQNTALHTLTLTDNQLTSLDVTQNTQLGTLSCNENYITSLNLSNNSLLEELYCNFNQLTALTIKNGSNYDISNFVATNNPNLNCIEVDDDVYSTANWTNIDAQSYFSNDCGKTYVPDDNFEQALIDLGYDTGIIDNYVPTTNINLLTSINISNKNISDLTGIEDFTSLTNLICFNNQLTNIDLSQNLNLTDLRCYNNQLTTLDVSQNTALDKLFCNDNELSSIDITQNLALTNLSIKNNLLTNLNVTQHLALTSLNCENNYLTELDITQNTLLETLFCSYNPLTNLNVTQNTALETLYCRDNQLVDIDITQNLALTDLSCGINQLTSLDLSLHTNLRYLWARDNQLTSLNIKNGNNTNFTIFNANVNPNLTCIEVDNAAWSTANWTNIDATASFSESCSLSVNNFDLDYNIIIYPNPTKNIFKIEASLQKYTVNLYNSFGKLIKQFNQQEKYNISNLAKGIYFVEITNTYKNYKQKLIIK